MSDRGEETKFSILRALNEATRPIGASQIAATLLADGIDLQPRTIRHYLIQMDNSGYTRLASRRTGREITEKGRQEILNAGEEKKACVVSAKVDTLAYRMTFDISSGTGSVITNVALINPVDAAKITREMQLAASRDFVVGKRICIANPGETIGDVIIPDGFMGIGTVCGITLNGIFQKRGIPVVSRFGGLLEIRERRITRFLNMIEYSGSTLDPLEIFIRADMTRVRNVILRGSGIICASFREIPWAALEEVKSVTTDMKKHGLGGILATGRPGQPLFGINVSEGHCGMVVTGGLNAVAAAKETGVRLSFFSLAGLEDYDNFINTREAARRLR